MIGLNELKKNKTVMVCKFCNHKCLPWQTGGVFKFLGGCPPGRTSILKCTKCDTIESIYSIEDEKLALEIWEETIGK